DEALHERLQLFGVRRPACLDCVPDHDRLLVLRFGSNTSSVSKRDRRPTMTGIPEFLLIRTGRRRETMDALSEALKAVHMTGAIFFNAEFTKPWGFEAAGQRAAPVLAPGTERLMPYHLVIEGEAQLCIDGTTRVGLGAGDVIVVPHGDTH